MTKEISLSEAAAVLGYRTTAHMRRACQAGEIRGARKVGKTWLVTPAAARAWADSRKAWGGPRGQPRQPPTLES